MLALRMAAKRTMATVAAHHHAALPITANSTRLVASLLGAIALVPVITLAPANTFDDLDCESYCQRKLLEGLPK